MRSNQRVFAVNAWAVFRRLPSGRYARTAIALIVSATALSMAIASIVLTLPPELTSTQYEQSIRFEDKRGGVLREVRSRRGDLTHWVGLGDVEPLLPRAIVAIEDRRFYHHPGVDPLALVRAIGQAVWSGRVVSGASTITMQLARTLVPHRRSLLGKLSEMALALRIEATLTKPQILEQYLNRVDFGPNLRGVSAASMGYFGQAPKSLSRAQIALLAGLPQSPSGYAPRRYAGRALQRRNRVLAQLFSEHLISSEELVAAQSESLGLHAKSPAFGAPHLVSGLLGGALAAVQPSLRGVDLRHAVRLRTTIDPMLQRATETALIRGVHALLLHHVTAGAAVVIDNASGDVLAYVGSPDFYDDVNHGQVDAVRALRQPGSTLKPFVYAEAFEALGYTAATILPDLPLSLQTPQGTYAPRNFDDKFRGPVRLREALGNSLNVPAVHTAMAIGTDQLLSALRRWGFSSLTEAPEYYGPALALGDGEVTLLELTSAYVTLARGGRSVPLRMISEATVAEPGSRKALQLITFPPGEGREVISESSAAVITDILKDKTARSATFGLQSVLGFDFDVAAKTGTSKGFRDNWVVGYSKTVTVGVWIGNWDGSPMREVSGVSGAGPVFRAVMLAASSHRQPENLPLPRLDGERSLANRYGIALVDICPISGMRRGPHCPHGIGEYLPIARDTPWCSWHQTVNLDKRNGLLAGLDCPAGVVESRVFETLPDEYANWALSLGKVGPPKGSSPNCPVLDWGGDSSKFRLVHPVAGSRFVLDPERTPSQQALHVEGLMPPHAPVCLLLIDNVEEAANRSSCEFFWQLRAGHHRLQLRAGEQLSNAVEIDVRDGSGTGTGNSWGDL